MSGCEIERERWREILSERECASKTERVNKKPYSLENIDCTKGVCELV